MNRLLFLTRRWVRIVLSVLILLSSGFAIVYAETDTPASSKQLPQQDERSPADGWLSTGAGLAGINPEAVTINFLRA